MASLRAFASSANNTATLFPSRTESMVRNGGLALAASAFVALCAHVAVPLPFSPVPFTLQPFAVLLVALLLSPSVSFAAMIAYLAEGASGLPVFSPAGPGGVAQLLGPTGGYLFAYAAAAPLAGWMLRRTSYLSRFVSGLAAGSASLFVVFAMGAAWLGMELHVSAAHALSLAVIPFLPSEAVKLCAAASIASAIKSHRNNA